MGPKKSDEKRKESVAPSKSPTSAPMQSSETPDRQSPKSPSPKSTIQQPILSGADYGNETNLQDGGMKANAGVSPVPEQVSILMDTVRPKVIESVRNPEYRAILAKLLLEKDNLQRQFLSREEFSKILQDAKPVVMRDAMLIKVPAPITICGDIHGQYYDLLRLFSQFGWPGTTRYLFLGDYVDRGDQSMETAALLLAFKIIWPKSIFLLRGNHECISINHEYGFYAECCNRYGETLYKSFNEVFACLPVAAVVSERIFCAHGGISESLKSFEQISRIQRPLPVISDQTLLDILWSDPSDDEIGYIKSTRGEGSIFGTEAVDKFCDALGIDTIVRAHQVYMDGYRLFATKRVVSIFSAPRYGGQYENVAAVLVVKGNLEWQIKILK